ncbi:MAG: Rho termination factor N-terminal domain-containing protein [Actinomycetota bacterium]
MSGLRPGNPERTHPSSDRVGQWRARLERFHRLPDLTEALRASVEAAKQDRKDDLAQLSREELYERAQRLGIPGRSGMNKDEVIAALEKAS